MLLWIAVVVWVYLTARVICPLPVGLWRVPLALLLLALLRHHYLTYLTWGSMFSPEVPRPVTIVVNWFYAATVLFAVLHVAVDAASLVVAALRRRRPSMPKSIRAFLAIAALAVSGYAVSSAVVVPEVEDVEIRISDLPPALDGFRILQLTDLHISRMFDRRWTSEVVDRATALGADMILVTGDVIDGTVEARRGDVEPLRRLTAPHGVHLIPGNHEYYFGYDRWMSHLAGLGMQPLVNAHRVIEVAGARLVLAGVADHVATRHGHPGPDLAAALAGRPDGPIVLMQHRPQGANANANAGVDLQLSGHTHGGMIAGFDRLVANANEGFVSGAYPLGDMTLYVSNGTALWVGFAYRILRPPELTRLTLRTR